MVGGQGTIIGGKPRSETRTKFDDWYLVRRITPNQSKSKAIYFENDLLESGDDDEAHDVRRQRRRMTYDANDDVE